jgi:poly(ADP-ribose) glycohydrolase ARH3
MTSAPADRSLRDRFLGCVLGSAIGDAACAPYEGVPATAIWYDFGGAAMILNCKGGEPLTYTDDTQMSISVAETLITCGRIDEPELVRRFAESYDPDRGYGPGARVILQAMRDGGDWRSIAETVFPGGSLGNGAAMRVAPIGLFFHHDLDRVELEAERSALPTHVHPVGIDGARVLALAVALATHAGQLNKSDFYAELIRRAKTPEFRTQLTRAADLKPDESVSIFGSRLEADRSVTTAIAAFTMTPDSYPATIATCLCLGGDVDTLAAMAGAISGAYLGLSAVPTHLLDRLENGYLGKDYLADLANLLHDKHHNPPLPPKP